MAEDQNTSMQGTSPQTESASVQKPSRKRGFKHSKKFSRSQKGCLQCRQKKKKCDMTRPHCQSCRKSGSSCEYPENIKIFQIESFEPVQYNGEKLTGKPPKMREIVFSADSKPEQSSTSPQKIERSQSVDSAVPSALQDRKPLDMATRKPQTFTEATTKEAPSSPLEDKAELHYPAEPQPFPVSTHPEYSHTPTQSDQVNSLINILTTNNSNTERAITLATEGVSIRSILDNINMDLIKRSIDSLQFISMQQQRQRERQRQEEEALALQQQIEENTEEKRAIGHWAITEALKFNNDATPVTEKFTTVQTPASLTSSKFLADQMIHWDQDIYKSHG